MPNFQTANSKLDLAERLCVRMSRGEKLKAHEFELFHELGFDKIKIEREVRRAGSIDNLQKIAGKQPDLTAKKTKLAELKKTTAATIEHFDAQIGELMANRDSAVFAERDLESDVNGRERAVESLRTKCPAHVLRIHQQMVGQLKNSTFNREMILLQSQVRTIQGLHPIRIWSDAHARQITAIAGGLQDECPGILDSRGRVSHAIWAAHAAQQLAELPALEARLTEMETEFADRMNEIDKSLDFYVLF